MYGVLVFNVDKCVAWCGFVGLDGVGYLVKYFVVVSYAKPFYLLVSALDTKCSRMSSRLFAYNVQFGSGVYLIMIYILVVPHILGALDMPKSFYNDVVREFVVDLIVGYPFVFVWEFGLC